MQHKVLDRLQAYMAWRLSFSGGPALVMKLQTMMSRGSAENIVWPLVGKGLNSPLMRTGAVLLALCLALVAVLAAVMLVPVAPNGTGLPHPEIKGMFIGGDGQARHVDLVGLGWLFAMLMSALGSFLLWLGFSGGRHRTGMRRALWGSLPWLPLVFTGIFASYPQFMDDPTRGWWLGLPEPTAWMLYGLWLAPLVFVVVYVAGFERWVFSAQDARRFEALLARRAALGQPGVDDPPAVKTDLGGDD